MTAGSGVKTGSEVKVAFPGAGVIRIESAHLFGAPDEGPCRRFLQAALRFPRSRARGSRRTRGRPSTSGTM
jgi:hypothetical protein